MKHISTIIDSLELTTDEDPAFCTTCGHPLEWCTCGVPAESTPLTPEDAAEYKARTTSAHSSIQL